MFLNFIFLSINNIYITIFRILNGENPLVANLKAFYHNASKSKLCFGTSASGFFESNARKEM